MSLDELGTALSVFGATTEEVQNMLEIADTDGDGQVRCVALLSYTVLHVVR